MPDKGEVTVEGTKGIDSSIITSSRTDIHLSGVNVIEDDLIVPADTTLHITSSAKLFIKDGIGIYIGGSMMVDGKPDARVEFSAFNPGGSWKGIVFEQSANTLISYMSYSTISDAEIALSYQLGQVNLVGMIFNDNSEGLTTVLSEGSITGSDFDSNTVALLSDNSRLTITNCSFENSINHDLILQNTSLIQLSNVSFGMDKIRFDDRFSELEIFQHLKITVADLEYPKIFGTKLEVIDLSGKTVHSILLDTGDTSGWLKTKTMDVRQDLDDSKDIDIDYHTSHLVQIYRFGALRSKMVYLDSSKHLVVPWWEFTSNISGISKSVSEIDQQAFMHDIVNLGWRHTIRQEKTDTLLYLASRMKELGNFQVAFDNHTHKNFNIDNGTTVDLKVSNLVCTLPGTSDESDGYLVLSAHYDVDHHENVVGADDDGSGLAALLENARLIGRTQFNKTIKFIFFDAEDEGYIGSLDYNNLASGNGHKIITDVNLDMIGYNGNKSYPCIIRTNTNSLDIAQTYSNLNTEIGTGLDVRIINDASYRRSDYFRFWDAGYKAVAFVEAEVIETWNPYYHTSSDTYDKINFSYLSKMTGLAAAGLSKLAQVQNTPPTEPKQISPETTHLQRPRITWTPSVDIDGDPVKYHLKVYQNKNGAPTEQDKIIDKTLTFNYYQLELDLIYGSSYKVEVSASDQSGKSSKSNSILMMLENNPPELSPVPDQMLIQDVYWELSLSAVDTDLPADTLEFFDNSNFFDINRTTGYVNWTPTKTEVGIFTINFSVSDGHSGSDFQAVVFNVQNINDAPEIRIPPGTIFIYEDQNLPNALDLNNNFFDIDGDKLEFETGPSQNLTLTVNNNGTLDISPNENWFGFEKVLITVYDPYSLSASAELEIYVTSVNDPPVLEFIPDIYLNESEILNIEPVANDVDGDELSFNYSWPGFNGIKTMDYFSSGLHLLNITVSDGIAIDWQVVNITVANHNRPPLILNKLPAGIQVKVNEIVTITADFIDPDDDRNNNGKLDGYEHNNLSYIWYSSDGFEYLGDRFEYRYAKPGSYKLTLSVIDGDNATIDFLINITVQEKQHDSLSNSLVLGFSFIIIVIVVIVVMIMLKRKMIESNSSTKPLMPIRTKRVLKKVKSAAVTEVDNRNSEDTIENNRDENVAEDELGH